MLLFRSEEHVAAWCSARQQGPGAVLSLDVGADLARRWYQHKLSPEWRRFTLAEVTATFADLGLTGPFWDLP